MSEMTARLSISRKAKDRLDLLLALGQRLLMGALTLLVIIFLTFLGLEMARGTAFGTAFFQALDKTAGYLSGLLRGDWGMTVEYGLRRLATPVAEVLPEIMLRSFGLLLVAMGFATFAGILLGILAARRRHSRWPLVVLVASVIGVSLPSFFIALLLQMLVIRLSWIFGHTILPVGGLGWDEHLLLPALVLAARPLAQISRVTYVTLTDILDQDYIRTAYSKGLTTRRVMNLHVLRNAAVPVLTTISVSLRFALSSLPIVELFFGWMGLGYHLLRGIATGDDVFVVGMLVILGAVFIFFNLLLELSYRIIDPRLRAAVEGVTRSDQYRVREWLLAVPSGIWIGLKQIRQIVRHIPAWWQRQVASFRARGTADEPGSDAADLSTMELAQEVTGQKGLRRAWLRATVGNFSFVVGGVLMLVLLATILFGADFAPHSPYTTRGLTLEKGQFSTPPFPPGETYPWGTDVLGRDIMSLILAGAQQTFLLASLVLLARLVVGFFLGAIAGWWSGSWLDRFLLSTVEVIATFPTLLFAMILILALDIRTGMRPFVIALCLVGWGEIMQFVRAEVMRLRPRLFIESAVAAGQRTPGILLHHILPNLVPALISLAALEMGAVLLLLGELGFIGIFIGGGLFAELQWQAPLFHYSDVPEWGSLLANVRTYARSYPWTGLYPGLAFFLAILSLNLLGDGLRRMIDIVGVRIVKIFNRYTLALGLALVVGFVYWRGSTGAMAVYARQASTFDAQTANTYLQQMTAPEMEGRALGSQGLQRSANWIAARFEALDLQPAGKNFTYFDERQRAYQQVDATPQLVVDGGETPLVYGTDFNLYPIDFQNSGESLGPLRFVALGPLSSYTRYGYSYLPRLEKVDYPGQVLMLRAQDAFILNQVQYSGALVIAETPQDLQRRYTLSPYIANWMYSFNRQTDESMNAPTFWITQDVADRLLQSSGRTYRQLMRTTEDLAEDEIFELALDQQLFLKIPTSDHEREPVFQVIGHLPGAASNQYGGLDDQVVLVMAQYDCPPIGPEGVYPCANDNASGIALMLEIIDTMRRSEYQPYRTFLFVAYSGEGFEGGHRYSPPDVEEFLQSKFGFAQQLDLEAVVELRGLGSRSSDHLLLSSDGSLRLAKVFEAAARRMQVDTRLSGEEVELGILFEDQPTGIDKQPAPRIRLSWDDWEETSHCPTDTLEAVSVEQLKRAGKAISLGLMIIGREPQY